MICVGIILFINVYSMYSMDRMYVQYVNLCKTHDPTAPYNSLFVVEK